jgi:hypothetical protein
MVGCLFPSLIFLPSYGGWSLRPCGSIPCSVNSIEKSGHNGFRACTAIDDFNRQRFTIEVVDHIAERAPSRGRLELL